MTQKNQTELTRALAKVTAEANGIFTEMGKEIQKQCDKGVAELDVLEIARKTGLEIDESILDELKIDRTIFVHPWLPWYVWYPWRPLWCWWWKRYHPWYRCCPWWWNRCHWYPF